MPAKPIRTEFGFKNLGPRYNLVSQTPDQLARMNFYKRMYPGAYDFISRPVYSEYKSLHEEIREGVSPTGFKSRELTNFVRHTKIKTKHNNIPRRKETHDDGVWSVPAVLPGQHGFHSADSCWRPAVDRMGTFPPDIDGMIQDLREELFPQMNPLVLVADDLNPFDLVDQALNIETALETLRKNIPSGETISRQSANAYLAGHLQVVPGVMSLISWNNRRVLYENLRAQANDFKRFGRKFRSRATVNKGTQRSERSVSPWSREKVYSEISGEWTITYYCTAKGSLDVPPSADDIIDTSAFEFLDEDYDPAQLVRTGAEALWELTPLSFVFDYFFPVGNMLSGVAASNVTVSNCGEMCKYLGTYSTGNYHPDTGWYECSRSEIKDFCRSYSDWAIPDGFVFDWNNVLGPLGPRRQLTLLSLARSFT